MNEVHAQTIIEMEEENRQSGQTSLDHHTSTQGPTSNTINEESMVMMEESEYQNEQSMTNKGTFIKQATKSSRNSKIVHPMGSISKQGSNPSIISEDNIKFKVLNNPTNPGSNYSKTHRITERSIGESKQQQNFTLTPNDSGSNLLTVTSKETNLIGQGEFGVKIQALNEKQSKR